MTETVEKKKQESRDMTEFERQQTQCCGLLLYETARENNCLNTIIM